MKLDLNKDFEEALEADYRSEDEKVEELLMLLTILFFLTSEEGSDYWRFF